MTAKKLYDGDGREYRPATPMIEIPSEPTTTVSSTDGLNESGAAESTVSLSEPEQHKE